MSLSNNTSNLKTCPTCGLQVKPNAKICPRDGTNLLYARAQAPVAQAKLHCPLCRQQFDLSLTHCPQDKFPLVTVPPPEPSQGSTSQGPPSQGLANSAPNKPKAQAVAPTLLSHELPRIAKQNTNLSNQVPTLISTDSMSNALYTGRSAEGAFTDGAPAPPAGSVNPVQAAPDAKKTCPTCGLKLSPTVQICPQDGTNLNPIFNDPAFNGKFEFLESIGAGGMGVIYKARHLILNKIVAIKMLHSHLQSGESVRRFQIEAKAASILSHPNIVAVHDVGTTANGQPYMVMDFVAGQTLDEILAHETCLDSQRFYNIFQQVCDALEHAHKRKVLHRDIKPSNIMIAGRNNVKIMDFGIAKIIGDTESGVQHLTKTGDAIGSPIYMSPEQARGIKLDQRSDLYSLGCVIYECLAGTPPFQGSTALDTMLMHMNKKPLSMKQASMGTEIDSALENIVMRLLEKEPDDRYQSMSELGADLAMLHDAREKGDNLKLRPPVKAKAEKHKSDRNRFLKIISFSTALLLLLIISVAMLLHARKNEKEANAHPPKQVTLGGNLLGLLRATDKVLDGTKKGDLNSLLDAEKIDLNDLVICRAVDGTPVEDKDFAPLRQAKLATQVKLCKARVTDRVLQYLQGLKNLQILELDLTDVQSLAGIENFTKLRELSLKGCIKLNAAGLKRIGKLNDLQSLNISRTTVDGLSLKNLYGLKNLNLLDIHGCTYLKESDVQALKAHLPQLVVRENAK